MVKQEANKQISDAIRYSSPLSYDTKGPDLNKIKEALFKQQKKEFEQNNFENNYLLNRGGNHTDSFDSQHVYSNKGKNEFMKALNKNKAFDPRFSTMTSLNKRVSLEGTPQQ